MEYEVRFYYSSKMKDELLNELSSLDGLVKSPRTYEKTTQYNHSDPRYDFYSKEIDGRFRVRMSINDIEAKCKLSWKQRVDGFNVDLVNKEIEKEVNIKSDEVENFEYILNEVMHFSIVESYERYRTTFSNEDIEIALDEYPFGIALEIENKSKTKNPEETVINYLDKLGLDVKDSYKLSWDDKYAELCKEQGLEICNEVTFDKPMPKI